eukprot:353127-Chlamydomonas_euryale.AAC.4
MRRCACSRVKCVHAHAVLVRASMRVQSRPARQHGQKGLHEQAVLPLLPSACSRVPCSAPGTRVAFRGGDADFACSFADGELGGRFGDIGVSPARASSVRRIDADAGSSSGCSGAGQHSPMPRPAPDLAASSRSLMALRSRCTAASLRPA